MQSNKMQPYKLEAIIRDEIRPLLQSHQGDIQLVSWEENGTVTVQLIGACATCPSSQQTLSSLVETKLKISCPQVKQVVLLQQVSDSLIKQALQMLRRARTDDKYQERNE